MNELNRVKIFLVDDDALFLKSLEMEFKLHGDFEIETYTSGELCFQNLKNHPDAIILDYHLDGIEKGAMNGMETLDRIKESDPNVPVVILSSQDKIEVAIQCMHHKAFDYVVKSETSFMRLQKILTSIFELKNLEKKLNWYKDRM